MDKSLLLGIVILAFILCMIWVITDHNKLVKQVKLDQLRDLKSKINNALSLYDCLYIHIDMYKKGFTKNKSLTSKGIVFLLGSLSSKKRGDFRIYRRSL